MTDQVQIFSGAAKKVMGEIFQTEESFIAGIAQFVELDENKKNYHHFSEALQDILDSSKEVIDLLKLSNECINGTRFLSKEQAEMHQKKLNEAMKSHMENISKASVIYSDEKLNSKLKPPSSDQAILVVQRIPRYVLLGKELETATNKEASEKWFASAAEMKAAGLKMNRDMNIKPFNEAFEALNKDKSNQEVQKTALNELEKAIVGDYVPAGFDKKGYSEIFSGLSAERLKKRQSEFDEAYKLVTNRNKPSASIIEANTNIENFRKAEKAMLELEKSSKYLEVGRGEEKARKEAIVAVSGNVLKSQIVKEHKEFVISWLQGKLEDLNDMNIDKKKELYSNSAVAGNNNIEIIKTTLKEASKDGYFESQVEKTLKTSLEVHINEWEKGKKVKDIKASEEAFECLEESIKLGKEQSNLRAPEDKFKYFDEIKRLIGVAQGTLYKLPNTVLKEDGSRVQKQKKLDDFSKKNQANIEKAQLEQLLNELLDVEGKTTKLGGVLNIGMAEQDKKRVIFLAKSYITNPVKKSYLSEIDPKILAKALSYLNKREELPEIRGVTLTIDLPPEDLENPKMVTRAFELAVKLSSKENNNTITFSDRFQEKLNSVDFQKNIPEKDQKEMLALINAKLEPEKVLKNTLESLKADKTKKYAKYASKIMNKDHKAYKKLIIKESAEKIKLAIQGGYVDEMDKNKLIKSLLYLDKKDQNHEKYPNLLNFPGIQGSITLDVSKNMSGDELKPMTTAKLIKLIKVSEKLTRQGITVDLQGLSKDQKKNLKKKGYQISLIKLGLQSSDQQSKIESSHQAFDLFLSKVNSIFESKAKTVATELAVEAMKEAVKGKYLGKLDPGKVADTLVYLNQVMKPGEIFPFNPVTIDLPDNDLKNFSAVMNALNVEKALKEESFKIKYSEAFNSALKDPSISEKLKNLGMSSALGQTEEQLPRTSSATFTGRKRSAPSAEATNQGAVQSPPTAKHPAEASSASASPQPIPQHPNPLPAGATNTFSNSYAEKLAKSLTPSGNGSKPHTPPPISPRPPIPTSFHAGGIPAPAKALTSISSSQNVDMKKWVPKDKIDGTGSLTIASKLKENKVEYSLTPGDKGTTNTQANNEVYQALAKDIFDNLNKIKPQGGTIEIRLSSKLEVPLSSQDKMLIGSIEEQIKTNAVSLGKCQILICNIDGNEFKPDEAPTKRHQEKPK